VTGHRPGLPERAEVAVDVFPAGEQDAPVGEQVRASRARFMSKIEPSGSLKITFGGTSGRDGS